MNTLLNCHPEFPCELNGNLIQFTNFSLFNCLWPKLKITFIFNKKLFLLPSQAGQIEPHSLCLGGNDKGNINLVMLESMTNSEKIQLKILSEINIKSFFFPSSFLAIVPYLPFHQTLNRTASCLAGASWSITPDCKLGGIYPHYFLMH